MELPRATFTITSSTTDEQFLSFLEKFRPSVVRPDQHSWIQIEKPHSKNDLIELADIDGAITKWNSGAGPRSKTFIDKLAKEYLVLVGKWIIFPSPATVDDTWMAIALALRSGSLGSSAKVYLLFSFP
jgi:hypothetical protein